MVAIVTVVAINRHLGANASALAVAQRRQPHRLWRGRSRHALLAIVRNWVLAIRDRRAGRRSGARRRIDPTPTAPYRRAGLERVDSRRRNCCDVA
jgi:hypothetical protein